MMCAGVNVLFVGTDKLPDALYLIHSHNPHNNNLFSWYTFLFSLYRQLPISRILSIVMKLCCSPLALHSRYSLIPNICTLFFLHEFTLIIKFKLIIEISVTTKLTNITIIFNIL